MAALVPAGHRAVLAVVRDLFHVREELGNERHPERIPGQKRDARDLAGRNGDVILAGVEPYS